MRRFAVILMILGFSCMLYSVVIMWQQANPQRLAFDVTFTEKKEHEVAKKPKRIIIQKANIDVAVIPSKIHKGEWETTTKGVSYLKVSPTPGEVGNSILYGHNFDNLFGKLPQVIPGDVIQIVFTDNSNAEFIVASTQVVTPKQVDIIKPTTDTRVTLYTCIGFMDEKRFVVVAKPKLVLDNS